MAHHKATEKLLDVVLTDAVSTTLDGMHQTWKLDHAAVPRGLSCSESNEGEFVLVAAPSAFALLPGACVVKGLGAIQLLGDGHAVMEGANSPNLLFRCTDDGWRVSVKFVPPKPPRRRTLAP